MKMTDKIYDTLKWIAQYLLPALATFWMTLAKTWNLPYPVEIGATVSAVDLFLGAILGISSKNYQGDGTLVINDTDPEKDVYSLELNDDVSELTNKKKITFVVNSSK